MSSSAGSLLRLTIFGESHAPAIGVTVEGLPAGEEVDLAALRRFLARRAPGQGPWATARREADEPEILCGLLNGRTCGTPLTAVIRNTNARSGDYTPYRDTPRPGHADYTGHVRYGGYSDPAGGGHFSGRLTAPLCVAGGICLQILKRRGVSVMARILSVGEERDDAPFSSPVGEKPFPVSDDAAATRMLGRIERAKAEGDSVGGVVECMITGLPAGVGDPIFDGMENRIAKLVFGIPAVKGLEFGDGFALAAMAGSEANDPFCMRDGRVETETNRCGGILGGITTGMPLVFRAAFKPTPSIARPQRTVDLRSGGETEITVGGRHDPCVVPRAVPCVEAAAAAAVLDALLTAQAYGVMDIGRD